MIRLREVHCKGCGKFVSDRLQRQYCYKCRPRVRDPWRKVWYDPSAEVKS